MKIVFFGTPYFAKEILKYLIDSNVEIAAIVTQPDRVNGKRIHKPDVKKFIESENIQIPLYQPIKASSDDFIEILKQYEADLFVVVAYGQILKQKLIDLPKLCCINVHSSLLPKYRGAAPMQRVLMNGEKETGVTIMKLVLKMDAGDIIDVSRFEIPDEMNLKDLEAKMLERAKPLLLKVIKQFQNNDVSFLTQDETKVTYASKILPEDRIIDWSKGAKEIHNQIRGISPKPGAYAMISMNGEEKRLNILKTAIDQQEGKPGKVLVQSKKELIVGCSNHSLNIKEVQLEGKKPMDISAFLAGLHEKIYFL